MSEQSAPRDGRSAEGQLRRRAERLARPPPEVEAGQHVDVLIARVRGEEYALDLRRLTAIQPVIGLTSVPGAPSHVAGLINVRGELHTVLDLGATLDLVGERAVGEASRVLLVESADGQVGLLVDEVVGVRRLPSERLARPLSGREVARGIAEGRTVVLDLEQLLASGRLEVVDDVS